MGRGPPFLHCRWIKDLQLAAGDPTPGALLTGEGTPRSDDGDQMTVSLALCVVVTFFVFFHGLVYLGLYNVLWPHTRAASIPTTTLRAALPYVQAALHPDPCRGRFGANPSEPRFHVPTGQR
jgi:hypothetical protein